MMNGFSFFAPLALLPVLILYGLGIVALIYLIQDLKIYIKLIDRLVCCLLMNIHLPTILC